MSDMRDEKKEDLPPAQPAGAVPDAAVKSVVPELEAAEPKPETPAPKMESAPPVPLLRIKGLGVTRAARAELENFSLSLAPGATITLLGETGCGKEALLRVLTGMTARGEETSGTIQLGHGEARAIEGQPLSPLRVAFLPGPLAPVLNPRVSALAQLALIIARKIGQPRGSARAELALALGRLPGAPNTDALDRPPAQVAPEDLATALLACALAQTPELIIAADPLAELSPAHARALAAALESEQKRLGFAMLYAAASADAAQILGGNVIVLRAGHVVEEGPVSRLTTAQSHAYTQTLFRARAVAPKEPPPPRTGPRGETVLQVQGIQLAAHGRSEPREKLTFELRRGGSLALFGEEGSGRRELTRALLGLDPVAAGRIVFDQVDIGILNSGMMSRLRRRIAFITGDDDALDPRLTLYDAVAEPLRASLRMPSDLIARNRDAALKRVGLAALPGSRAVASLSRFDRRRLQIARAIVGAPLLAVIDEPLRGLDAFAQGVMRDILRSLRTQENPAFLVITASFPLVQEFCEDVFVFRDGRVVERGTVAALMRGAKDEYTRRIMNLGAPKSSLSSGAAGV
ncbi:MAG TPA: ATP-binding cassette domain-containing protein [Rhizomicrobium sp.]|nr:ATP-binding cassette domain-containing protein [Rhizomicrobium sp.]